VPNAQLAPLETTVSTVHRQLGHGKTPKRAMVSSSALSVKYGPGRRPVAVALSSLPLSTAQSTVHRLPPLPFRHLVPASRARRDDNDDDNDDDDDDYDVAAIICTVCDCCPTA